ncbi:MAG: cytochrome b5 domain-containing protein [Alphaproteobacteria bacterium]|nr:cytochrome b5 domain-containing protein [Alphaproteobacteria bacterium]
MLLSLLATAHALTLTTAEVARHDTPTNCWMVIEGQVYDLTDWVGAHPGGDEILRGCGKDASWFFEHRDLEGGHSEAARRILEGYRLGAVGDEIEDEGPSNGRMVSGHPHEARLEGARVGLLPASGVGPARSIALRVGHSVSTDADIPSGIGMQVGYSFGGLVDLTVGDYGRPGLGGLEVKVRPLHQHGARPMPLSVAVVGGGGYARTYEAPALYGQFVLERDLLDRKLALRANGTGALSPGVSDSARASAGLGVEFRPIPIHGIFGEVQVPFAAPDQLNWAAGLRLYTRGHTFAVFAASTPALSPWELAGPTDRQIAICGALEKAFFLKRR